jgi:hypothetical protein
MKVRRRLGQPNISLWKMRCDGGMMIFVVIGMKIAANKAVFGPSARPFAELASQNLAHR